MATKMNTMTEINQLKTTLWRSTNRVIETKYESETDTLVLYFVNTQPEDVLVTHYLDEFVFVLFRHSDNEIVGMGIEGLDSVFAPHFANRPAWKLSRTGIQIAGIKDFAFGLQTQEKTSLNSRPPIRLVKKQAYDLSPEYAFT
jgi:hypothetical protein